MRVIVTVLCAVGFGIAATSGSAQSPGDDLAMSRRIDELLQQRWRQDDLRPAPAATDAEFLRRASLDLNGVIPRVSMIRKFLTDQDPDKRIKLIDQLLESPRFSSHMASTWRSFILPSDFDLTQLDRVVGLQNWLRQQFMSNLRYDRVVAEFLSATGSEEAGPAVFYQALEGKPEKLAARTSRIFLGTQMQCAECHDHPAGYWTQKDFWGYAAFFAQIPPVSSAPGTPFRLVDLPDGEVTLPDSDEIVPPQYPSGDPARQDVVGTRRQQLAIWMASRDNPFLARAAVNRVWAHLFGRGLVDPVDDMGPDNPPVHPELLTELSEFFVRSGFDMRKLFRVIACTEVYGKSSRSTIDESRNPRLFERMAVKRLTPEQLYDSLQQTLGIPTPPAGANGGRREFLIRMQSPARDATEYDLGLQQVLYLMNGQQVDLMTNIDNGGVLASLTAPFFDDQDRVEILFLGTLSRRPSEVEEQQFVDYLNSFTETQERKQATGDVLWALINSAEYQLNH